MKSKGVVNLAPARLEMKQEDAQRIQQLSPTLSTKSKNPAYKSRRTDSLIESPRANAQTNPGVKIVKIVGFESHYLAVDLEGRVYSFGEK